MLSFHRGSWIDCDGERCDDELGGSTVPWRRLRARSKRPSCVVEAAADSWRLAGWLAGWQLPKWWNAPTENGVSR